VFTQGFLCFDIFLESVIFATFEKQKKSIMKKLKIVATVVFLTIGIAVQAQKSVKIRFKPKVGSSLKTEMKMDMDMKMHVQEQVISTKMLMTFAMVQNTKARKKDVNDLDVIFDRVTVSMKNPMMNGSYDSDVKESTDPFAKQMAQAFAGVIDKPIPMSLTTRGELTEALDLSKIFTSIPASKAKELQEQMSNQYIHFPEKKVKVGESWTMKTPMAQMGEIEFTYTLLKINKKTLGFSIKGVSLTNDASKKSVIKASDISGTLTLNKKTGETIASKLNMDMKMAIENQGMSMDMDMNAVIEVTTKI